MYLEHAYRNFLYRARGFRLKLYLGLHGCRVGKGLKCLGRVRFRGVPRGNITIGNQVAIGHNVVIEITDRGHLTFDDHALIGDNCFISSMSEITIGKWCAIAENVSIRDSFHQLKRDEPYRLQPSNTAPVSLKEDTGIGAGSVVLMGSHVKKGVFIGSNSVVTRHDELEEYGIYAGNPLKLIKKRG